MRRALLAPCPSCPAGRSFTRVSQELLHTLKECVGARATERNTKRDARKSDQPDDVCAGVRSAHKASLSVVIVDDAMLLLELVQVIHEAFCIVGLVVAVIIVVVATALLARTISLFGPVG